MAFSDPTSTEMAKGGKINPVSSQSRCLVSLVEETNGRFILPMTIKYLDTILLELPAWRYHGRSLAVVMAPERPSRCKGF
jgi:hypothetical protein